MEQDKIATLMALYKKKIPFKKQAEVETALQAVPTEKYGLLSSVSMKSPGGNTALAIFFGLLGIDRFALGDMGLGVLKLLTGGVFGIMYLIDIFTAAGRTKEANFAELVKRL